MDDWLGEAGAVLFAHADDACAVLELLPDDQLRLVGGNAALSRLVEPDPSQTAGDPIDALYPGSERAELAQKVRRVVEDDAPLTYLVTRQLPTRRQVVQATMLPLTGRRTLACHRDVTQERAAIHEVHTLEALTETGSWSWSSVEGTLEVSDEFRRILGLSSDDEVSPDMLLEAVHPDDRNRVTGAIRRVLSSGRGGSEEVRLRLLRADGEVREVCWRGRAVRADDGTLIRAFGTVQDVTERTRLEHREKAIELAAAGQLRAIELNDDVIQILARAWLALDLELLDDTREAIEEALAHVRQIMSDLFEVAKGTRGGLRPGDLARPPAATTGSPRE